MSDTDKLKTRLAAANARLVQLRHEAQQVDPDAHIRRLEQAVASAKVKATLGDQAALNEAGKALATARKQSEQDRAQKTQDMDEVAELEREKSALEEAIADADFARRERINEALESELHQWQQRYEQAVAQAFAALEVLHAIKTRLIGVTDQSHTDAAMPIGGGLIPERCIEYAGLIRPGNDFATPATTHVLAIVEGIR